MPQGGHQAPAANAHVVEYAVKCPWEVAASLLQPPAVLRRARGLRSSDPPSRLSRSGDDQRRCVGGSRSGETQTPGQGPGGRRPRQAEASRCRPATKATPAQGGGPGAASWRRAGEEDVKSQSKLKVRERVTEKTAQIWKRLRREKWVRA